MERMEMKAEVYPSNRIQNDRQTMSSKSRIRILSTSKGALSVGNKQSHPSPQTEIHSKPDPNQNTLQSNILKNHKLPWKILH